MNAPIQKLALLAALMLAAIPCGAAFAQAPTADADIDELEGVGITEHLNDQVPLDLTFVDEHGETVKLSKYFSGKRPVILTLNYYNCPMLCTLQINGMVEALKEINLDPGNQYEIVTVSVNPAETPELAKAKKENYLEMFERPSAAKGWHFLTGEQENITKLADAVGFGYKKNEQTGEFMHVAALMICTPKGKLSRYIYGVQMEPNTMRLSLLEAAEGKFGSTIDRIILYCYQYNPEEGSYALAAMNVMRAGGVLTALILGSVLAGFWLRERRRKNADAQQPAE
jgi:protein SCO1/2